MNPAAPSENQPPFGKLFAASGVFTVGAILLVGYVLVTTLGPLRLKNQAAKNAPAVAQQQQQQPGGNLPANPIDPRDPWYVCVLIVGCSAILTIFSWNALRDSRQKSIVRSNPMVLGWVAFSFFGIFMTMLNAKNIPPQIAMAVWPLMLSMAAIPLPLSYVTFQWVIRRLDRGLERISFTPVTFDELPAVTQQHFEQFTWEMESLGFRHVADYRLKRHTPFFCRVFLSEDQSTFGELSTQRLMSLATMKTCAFATIFESGDYLETANLATKTHNVGYYHTRSVPGVDLAALYTAHEDAVQEISVQNETYPALCSSGDYPKISTYGHKLMYDRLVEEGITTRNIYEEPAAATA